MGWQGLSVHLVSQERLLADRLCQCGDGDSCIGAGLVSSPGAFVPTVTKRAPQ